MAASVLVKRLFILSSSCLCPKIYVAFSCAYDSLPHPPYKSAHGAINFEVIPQYIMYWDAWIPEEPVLFRVCGN